MGIPTIGDFKTFIGALLSNVEWNYNLNKIVSILTDGTYDLVINSFTTNSDASFGGYKAKNMGTPTLATDGANKAYVDNSTTPFNYISGLTLSNNTTTPNTDLDIAAGTAQNSTNTQAMTLSVAYTKRLSSSWVAGTGKGMLDTGSIATSTWYHIYLIAKSDGTTDILASTSATNPAVPSGYSSYRRIGSVKTDGSSNIISFKQKNNRFYYIDKIADINTTFTTANRALQTLSVPKDINTIAIFSINVSPGAGNFYNAITSPYQTDYTPTSTNCDMYSPGSGVATVNAQTFEILTNASSQIGTRSTTNSTFRIYTYGYIDDRGV